MQTPPLSLLRAALILVLLAGAGCDSVELPVFDNPNDTQLPGEPLVTPPDEIYTEPSTGNSLILRWTQPERPGTGFFIFQIDAFCSATVTCQKLPVAEVGPEVRTFEVDGLIGTAPVRLAVATRGELGGRSVIGLGPTVAYPTETLVTGGAGTRGVVSLDGTAVYAELTPGPDISGGSTIRAHDLTAGTSETLGYNVVVGAIGDREALLARAAGSDDEELDFAVVEVAAVRRSGTLASPGGPPEELAVSPDGRRAAGTFLQAPGQRGVALWDLDAGGSLRGTLILPGLRSIDRVLGVTGDVVVVYRSQQRLEAVNVVTGETLWSNDAIRDRAAYDPVTNRIFAYRNDNRFVTIDGGTGAVGGPLDLSTFQFGRPGVLGESYGLTFGGAATGRFYVLNVETDETIRVIEDGREFVTGRIVDGTLVFLSRVGGGTVRRIPLFGSWEAVD